MTPLSPAAIQAHCLGVSRLSDRILFIKREHRLEEYAARLLDVERFGNVWSGVSGVYHGERISVLATLVGPSNVGDCVYAVDRPGAKCLYSGTCGGLAAGLGIGDYFVATAAVCGDGYTLALAQVPFSRVEADARGSGVVARHLEGRGARCLTGTSFTTASFVRETEPGFWDLVDPACQAIEMGAAPFYAAARATGKAATAYFWVTDLPRGGLGFLEPLTGAHAEVGRRRFADAPALDLALMASL